MNSTSLAAPDRTTSNFDAAEADAERTIPHKKDEIHGKTNFKELLGNSIAFRRVLKEVETVAQTESTVVIYGETGTGKGLVARALHNLGPRRSNRFVKLNCAAIPTGLLESELFGHEKGAFTGAIAQRIGRFELANHGTVFLDEVGEIPLELQPKLLRVLQEREFERLGSNHTKHTDARLIAATNQDLPGMVKEGKFRSDLYYRLNVFPVCIPALRERPEDIPLLAQHFTRQFAHRMNKEIETIPMDVLSILSEYQWPGNIRELQNVIERAVIISAGPTLEIERGYLQLSKYRPTVKTPSDSTDGLLDKVLRNTEREEIVNALKQSNWIISGARGAATRLGMKRSTLQARIAKLGISRFAAQA